MRALSLCFALFRGHQDSCLYVSTLDDPSRWIGLFKGSFEAGAVRIDLSNGAIICTQDSNQQNHNLQGAC